MLAILNYEAGNQTSVLRALTALDIPAKITADASTLESADCVIFPGVGAARQAMTHLAATGLDKVLKSLVEKNKPLLGICLGCQILLDHSQESDTQTLGIIKGDCLRFDPALKDDDGLPICIPHMGWNSVKTQAGSPLFQNIDPRAEYYFVHSYYTVPDPEYVIGTTCHGLEFCSVFGRPNLWAVQFHPEKSGRPGLQLLRNFYESSKTKP